MSESSFPKPPRMPKKSKTPASTRHSGRSSPGPARIGDILPQLMARYGFQRKISTEKLEKAWKEAIGVPLDAATRVMAKRRNRLEIAVPHSAFVQELSFRETELVARLAQLVPEEKISSIKFCVKQTR